MSRNSLPLVLVGVLIGGLVGVGVVMSVVGPAAPGTDGGPNASDIGATLSTEEPGIAQFESDEAFLEYVRAGQQRDVSYTVSRATTTDDVARGDGGDGEAAEPDAAPQATPAPQATETEGGDGAGGSGGGPDRVGETNVQVAGLDEPDLVKTDGRHFYYAPGTRGIRHVVVEDGDERRRVQRDVDTHVIDVSEPADPAAVAEIDEPGRLLQAGDRLLVIQHDRILGYDVSEPSEPVREWTKPLESNLVTARERNGTVYLVTQTRPHAEPCPITPLGADDPVACTDVYRPDTQISVDATYTAVAMNATDGSVADTVSFVGSNRHTAVYMSHDNLYVTYTESVPRNELQAEFLVEEFERTPQDVKDRIREIESYDISASSERQEIQRAIQNWLGSLDEEQRETVSEELAQGYADFLADRQRDLTRTGIVRVDVEGTDLSVGTTGTVPGRPLNQFSMDEHDGTLRITTTIPAAGNASSVNDLYTLEAASLDRLGAETGMGDDQEVFAVRYVDDTAYVVTFRRIDPFHVVDLSDPSDPTELGELELPGFSSYLHPIDDNHVLGIGEEDGKVKTVLFDVSDPSNPTIAADRVFDARWSAVSDSHHAFTIDRRHEVFFLPAGESGHVIGYANGSLDLTKTVDMDARTTRARYVDDNLYVFAGTDVAVLDETTWNRTATLSLRD